MAEIKTRIYKYTDGGSNGKSGVCSLPLSGFDVSGDTDVISQVLSISVKYYRYHSTSSSVGHTAQLVVGSETFSTAKVVKRGSDDWHSITATFTAMPSASNFTASNVTFKSLVDTKANHVWWYGNSGHPITITVTYYSDKFEPFIKDLDVYRANSLGAASDSGTYLTFKATVGVVSTGSSGSGTLKLYKVSASTKSISGGTLVFTETGISGSTDGVLISKAKFGTLDSKTSQYFKAQFSYTATANGVSSTEIIESPAIYVGHVFTNVHLAGVSTGGVAFGRFSGSSQGIPKFECNYPTYLYGNIAHISDSPTSPKWRLLTPINGTTPGTYEGSPIGGGSLACRKIEDKRIISGSVLIKPPTEDQGTIVIADLAENGDDGIEWTPSCAVFSINACQGSRIARIVVGGRGETNAGKLCLSWVRNLSDGSIYSSAAIWVQCSIEYWWD